jgi:Ca2+-binding EF-hand superfamily protein
MADASESQHAVTALLSQWAACGRLSYKFSATPVASGRDGLPRMMATFSKPTAQMPAPEAVARLCFHLSADHQRVCGFTVEQDGHFHDLEAVRFDEAVLDRVVRRKLQLQAARLLDLSDEFASTRVPAVMRAREEEQREHERETTEKYLLEQMQHRDSYNDGKLLVEVFRETVEELDLHPRVAPREVLLALVASDRDDMMAYADFVAVAADMIDTMSGAGRAGSDGKTALRTDEDDEALDAFEVVSARQTHYAVEKLTALLEAHAERVADVANAVAARRSAAGMKEAQQEGADAIPEKTQEAADADEEEEEAEGSDGTTNETAGEDARSHARSRRRSSAKQRPRMTRYQLRAFLETPQLLLSEAEINLTIALAETKTNAAGVEEVLCEKLGSLLRRVRRMIFRFQRKGFVDRAEKYLLQQFQAFEKRALQGASKHLKQRLTQQEVKAAVKAMQKLLLSPYQIMQLVALAEECTEAPDRVVYYQEFVPRMGQRMRELVNVESLIEKSALLHEMGVWDFAAVGLPSEDVVRKASFDCFASFDRDKLGVIPIGDFRTALQQLSQVHGFPVDKLTEMTQLGALADPSGSGRVNYGFFQHLMYPLLLFFLQERELAAARENSRKRCSEQELKSE